MDNSKAVMMEDNEGGVMDNSKAAMMEDLPYHQLAIRYQLVEPS